MSGLGWVAMSQICPMAINWPVGAIPPHLWELCTLFDKSSRCPATMSFARAVDSSQDER